MYVQQCANPHEAPRHCQREGQRMRREMKNVRNSIRVSGGSVNMFGSYSLKRVPETDHKSVCPSFRFHSKCKELASPVYKYKPHTMYQDRF
jgi:hypothetical protein